MSIERGVNKWLQSENTFLARGLNTISRGKKGEQYLASTQKEIADKVIALGITPIAIGVTTALAAASKIEEPSGSIFYTQERAGKNGHLVNVWKVRTMKENSHNPAQSLAINISSTNPEDDPRNTRLGKIIRAYEIDEFPQIFQVLIGKIALIGLRCIPQYAIDSIKQKHSNLPSEWDRAYNLAPSLFSLSSAITPDRKNILKRHHADLFYAKHASLGFDLYILYRTGQRMWKKLKSKLVG